MEPLQDFGRKNEATASVPDVPQATDRDAASGHASTLTPSLPELPEPSGLDIGAILGSELSDLDDEKMQRRASNVLKLAQENDQLQAELRAMSERIEAAEARLTQEMGLGRNNSNNTNNKS